MAELAIAATQLGVAIADWLISPLAERLVNRAISYLGSYSSENLKNLETDTKLVKGILRAADAKPHRGRLEPWIKNLRAAYSEAEDILDIIDYHRIESHILATKHDKSASTAYSSNTGEAINIPEESKMKLKEALDKIRNLISEGHQLLSKLGLHGGCGNIKSTSSSMSTPITTTSFPPAFVFGREEERENIILDLRGPPAAGECYTVIGIHGVAGSGKTTLAQHVLDMEQHRKGDESIDVIMWIHVTKGFNEFNVTKEMLEEATGEKPKLSNLNKLQMELSEALKGKRFFLVLDDVWDEDDTEKKLELILRPLKYGKIGSKILMTSQTTKVANALGAKTNLIKDLNNEDYFRMFMHYALHNKTLTDKESTQYDTIGRRIADKLRRLPLAAKAVASQLRRMPDIDHWKDVMESDLWEDTMGALFWSYQQLEENVKQCFRYCSIFPRRYKLERDELVHLWMAEGFVETTSDEEDMEKVAKDYFHVLLSSSFIQPKQDTGGKDCFTIHDLLHDLAEDVAQSDCLRVKKGMMGQIPPDVRYIFIESCDPALFREQILKLKDLRTLIMSSQTGVPISEKLFESLLGNLLRLRVLHVRLEGLKDLPECIGELKHLRYLRYWGFPNVLTTLPVGFTKLYHLQKFVTTCATTLKCSASEEMANLVNLRYVVCQELSFPNIGSLRWLRTLGLFIVKKEKGYEIYQLQHLNKIYGTLLIQGLENVKSKEEALQAELQKKTYISHLTLEWSEKSNFMVLGPFPFPSLQSMIQAIEEGRASRVAEEYGTSGVTEAEVFEALRPPSTITTMIISGYSGWKYPSWLLEAQNDLNNLEQLELCDSSGPPENLGGCLNLVALCIRNCCWCSLPENMERLKSLRFLFICSCKNIQSLPELPESLNVLQIYDCPKLEESLKMGAPSREKIKQNIKIRFSSGHTRGAGGVLDLMRIYAEKN